ncbi:D-2-hydroxyacid dehydrogenase [Marinivivus vitaminiproducens]|uniref:D-2-hydroxyacid dehydrogenase n=1 Tax=Marinivivus vitaminiproducens TaxID=3035935 RepID=UPI00279FCB21|nr:D-2-hydroxyacid dehydrogenase [Geminicoccaceae bacterium SCSIO 64248]
MRIVIRGDIPPATIEDFRAAASQAEVIALRPDGDLASVIGDAEVVAGDVPADLFARGGRLAWVHSWAAGPDTQLYPAMIDSPVVLTCSKGNGAIPLAEHAILLMLMLSRDALRWIRAQDARRWERFRHGELNGLTCGIVGTGHSGADLAIKAKAFHMRTIGLSRSGAARPHFDTMLASGDLDVLLRESDFVVVTAPLTPETAGLIGEAELRRMKASAFIVCFSRGGIIDEAALLHALREGWIAGAGLDAHATEPLPADSPLWIAPNTIVTPHNGATTQATVERGYAIFRDNLARYVRGEPLRNVVDKHAGY